MYIGTLCGFPFQVARHVFKMASLTVTLIPFSGLMIHKESEIWTSLSCSFTKRDLCTYTTAPVVVEFVYPLYVQVVISALKEVR